MQYARLGNSGLLVSRLAFGAMTFGSVPDSPMKAIYQVDQKLADQLVAKAMDAGVNFFNTADAYSGGQSEEMLSKALGKKRKDVVIATKVGFRTGNALIHQGLSRQHIFASCEESLSRLNSDYIDVYLVHRVDPMTPIEETLDALNDLVRQGKVRYVGFSNWPAWMAAKAVGMQDRHDWAKFRAAEMYYSLVGRDLEAEVVPFIEDAGIGVMVWSPLAGGFLSGKYSRENPLGEGGRLSGFDFIPFDKEKGYDLVEKMRAIGKVRRATPAQVALAWLLAKRHVCSILIGATKMSQLEDNLAAVDVKLSENELKDLDAMTEPAPIYPGWFNKTTQDKAVQEAISTAALHPVMAG